ncbi:hypothetical protein [Bythopirellula goksoeyrii]|uniref:Uncharacterized protein n=1 Tax=Bythopirellula goksoeyrii TaxID=1400387 RepID=A0A5B9Q5D5_9BACT|nr:hypothetical protein [Bythopirellula goksoeyrii]QEG34248.1 hypothetical protein Pr1d_15220 [Bythopirellula goksoeyrii]
MSPRFFHEAFWLKYNRRMYLFRRLSIFLIAICSVNIGCSNQVERVALSGNVSFDKEPVNNGQVSFEPVQGESGKMEFGIIVDGKYSIPKEFGLVPGKYLVRITGDRATGKKAEQNAFLKESEGVSLEIYEQYIPPQYNTGSNLIVLIEPAEHLEKDFELTSE